MLYLLIGFFISLSTLSQAHADPIDAQFESFYYDSTIDARRCGANVDRFISQLASTNSIPTDMKRIVIRAPQSTWHMANMLIALNSRVGTLTSDHHLSFWDFHVVGLSKCKVYDFSFNNEPEILPVGEYLRKMFYPKSPIAIFGNTFRVRGKGPYYTVADAQDEVSNYSYEAAHISKSGKITATKKFENLQDFLVHEKCRE